MLSKLLLVSLFVSVLSQTQINIAGGRSYFVWPIPRNATEKVPLLIVLHGVTGDYNQAYQWVTGAQANRFVLIGARGQPYKGPSGNGGYGWNAGGCCVQSGDDLGYLQNVVKDAIARHNVDPSRVHLAGFSNGGMMTEWMLCKHPELFKTAVSVAGQLIGDFSRCVSGGDYNYLSFHGTADGVVPPPKPDFGQWNWDFSGWASRMGCGGESTNSVGYGWQTKTRQCRNGHTAEMNLVPGLGHQVTNDEVAYAWKFITKSSGGGNNSDIVHAPHGDIYIGRNYMNYDLPNMPIINVADNIKCQALCFGNKECAVFVHGSCTKRCWLKGQVGGTQEKRACTSGGVVIR